MIETTSSAGDGGGTVTARPLTISIPDKRELHKCYMPFVLGGGLFIPISDNIGAYNIGQKVFILLSLLTEKTRRTISGKVVWKQTGGVNKGVGVTLGEGAQAKMLKDIIETSIADIPNKSELPTYTV